MPHFILFLINKETDEIVSATFAKDDAESTIIKRECESDKYYVLVFNCDYSIREQLELKETTLNPKYILLVTSSLLLTNPVFATIAYSDEEVAIISLSRKQNSHISVFNCDYKMRE